MRNHIIRHSINVKTPNKPPKINFKSGQQSKYIQCIVEYNNNNNDLLIENWIMLDKHLNDKSFNKFLLLNSYILGRIKFITCATWNDIYIPCIECASIYKDDKFIDGIIITKSLFNKTLPLNAQECINFNSNIVSSYCKSSMWNFD